MQLSESEENTLHLVRFKVQKMFEGEGTGHDWWHIVRVCNTAKYLAQKENANLFLVEISALVHDIGDHKFHSEDNAQEILITQLLADCKMDHSSMQKILDIVKTVSYKGAKVDTKPTSLEGKIVQDADRLDAIGAIGIARAFAYGGNKNRLLYHPEESPNYHDNFEDYKNDKGHTINHFYEKLLLLKDRMQTKSGKELAEERHSFMEKYLQQFYREWNQTEKCES